MRLEKYSGNNSSTSKITTSDNIDRKMSWYTLLYANIYCEWYIYDKIICQKTSVFGGFFCNISKNFRNRCAFRTIGYQFLQSAITIH